MLSKASYHSCYVIDTKQSRKCTTVYSIDPRVFKVPQICISTQHCAAYGCHRFKEAASNCGESLGKSLNPIVLYHWTRHGIVVMVGSGGSSTAKAGDTEGWGKEKDIIAKSKSKSKPTILSRIQQRKHTSYTSDARRSSGGCTTGWEWPETLEWWALTKSPKLRSS